MWPDIPKSHIQKQAEVAGFVAVGLLFICMYVAYRLITRAIRSEDAMIILGAPSILVFLALNPVAIRVERWLTVRYCLTHGGHTFLPNAPSDSLRRCARCDYLDCANL